MPSANRLGVAGVRAPRYHAPNATSTDPEKLLDAAPRSRTLVQNLDEAAIVAVGTETDVEASPIRGTRIGPGESVYVPGSFELWVVALSGTPSVVATEEF